eukprot:GHVN01011984.1.p1 GENE.GHVN01011984.1~~GHVN01011984.1.p1  ORF type:complete len:154 (+),score=3.34 GHVN01011984.1:264-725(+)
MALLFFMTLRKLFLPTITHTHSHPDRGFSLKAVLPPVRSSRKEGVQIISRDERHREWFFGDLPRNQQESPLGNRFKAITYQKHFLGLISQPAPSPRIHNWMMKLQAYQVLRLEHLTGEKKNTSVALFWMKLILCPKPMLSKRINEEFQYYTFN